jgi:hypothetical protein
MNSKLTIIAAAILLPFAAQAEEQSSKTPGYQLKNRSAFSAPDDTRAPFWPIGWTKRVAQAAPVATAAPVVAKTLIDPNNYKITSILLGSPSLAVINGRAYEEGEYLKTPRSKEALPPQGSQPAPPRIRVQQIGDNAVVLQCADQQVTVNFNRPGLAAKGPNRELLLEDR